LRLYVSLLCCISAQAAIQSHVWREGKLALDIDGVSETIEWISPAAIRVTRSVEAIPLKHDPVLVAFEESALRMRSRYLTVDVAPDGGLRVQASDSESVSVDLRGPLPREAFGFTPKGYGFYRPSPSEVFLYYGPSPKEILEQHQIVTGPRQAPRDSTPLSRTTFDSWAKLADFVRLLNQQSLSAVLYPSFDPTTLANAPPEIKQRVLDLAALLPIVSPPNIDRATRNAFTPYLTTYLREAFDRGYPLIRPLPMQFPRDAGMDQHSDLFMLGDEFLLAPVIAAGDKRRVDLPRGLWTDLRTNTEYRGNQPIEIDAPPGRVPMFARNGSLYPLAARNKMELHYIPSLGGEFFLWEPEFEENSMFHAAPAAEELRVEIESKVTRTYEWVLHHTRTPRLVGEEGSDYRKVASRAALRAGTWWHDAERNNLHILLRAAAGSDRIVLVYFATQ
jgi:hypothetical protein